MNRTIFGIFGGLAFLLSACQGDDASPTTPAASSPSGGGNRTISKTLLASCPRMPAARLMAGGDPTTGAPTVPSSAAYAVDYGFYDTTGRFLGGGKTQIQDPSLASRYIAFTGKDAAGNALPTGHYLVFMEIRDESGNLMDEKSTCFGFMASPSP